MYTEDFKKRAVELAETSGLSRNQVSKQLGISPSTLRRWIQAHSQTTDSQPDSDSKLPFPPEEAEESGRPQQKAPSRKRPAAKSVSKTPAKPAGLSVKGQSEPAPPIPHNMTVRKDRSRRKLFALEKKPPLMALVCYAGAFLLLLLGVTAFQLKAPGAQSVWLLPQTEASLQAAMDAEMDESEESNVSRETLRRLARYAPLSSTPYEVGLAISDSNPDLDGEELAKAAITRDKRTVLPRLMRMRLFLEEENWDAAFDEVDVLYTIWPGGRDEIIGTLNDLVENDEEAAEILAARLQKDEPYWGRSLVQNLRIETVNMRIAREILKPYPDLYSYLIERIASQRDYRSAYLIWLSLNRSREDFQIEIPMDSHFLGDPSPRPFNWAFTHSGVDLEPDGGLYVTYDGRQPERLTWQSLVLTSGTYTLKTKWTGDIKRGAGDFEWRIVCVSPRITRASLPFYPTIEDKSALEVEFTVTGGGCSFVNLELRGIPGEYPRRIRAVVDYVEISPKPEAPQ